MRTVSDELLTFPFLRDLSSDEVRASGPLWKVQPLSAGQVLWPQGAPVDALGILASGELAAEVDGVEVGRVLPGELAGEASAFLAGAVRTAALRARTPGVVLLLPCANLRTLRYQRSGVYDALLAQALVTLSRRVRATDVRIAQVVQGNASAPTRGEPSALVRFWKALRPGGPTVLCPPLERLLLRQPGLAEAESAVVAAIAAHFTPQAVEEGEILFLEGEAGAASYIVAEGAVDVLRHVRGDRAELLATLRPGDQFGVNTLVERGARTASCVASTAGWLYRLDADGYARMRGIERRVWRESVLTVLASQIRNANGALRRASAPPKPEAAARPTRTRTDDGFQDLLRASGFLEALPVGESELESLGVVVTDDALRNPRGRVRDGSPRGR